MKYFEETILTALWLYTIVCAWVAGYSNYSPAKIGLVSGLACSLSLVVLQAKFKK